MIALLVSLSTLAAAGCVSDIRSQDEERGNQYGFSVVAIVSEAGLNIYHQDFQLGPEERYVYEALAIALGAEGRFVPDAHPDAREAAARDLEERHALEPGKLYWAEGTRVFGISFVNVTEGVRDGPLKIDYAPFGLSYHGAAVMSRLARVAPQSVIIYVNTQDVSYSERATPTPSNTIFAESFIEGTRWAATRPWIDVISLSTGLPGNPPDGHSLTPDAVRLAAATRLARENGKLVIAAAGNSIAPATLGTVNGPPWIVSVGMAEWSERGENFESAKLPDFAANTSVTVADHRTRNGTMGFGGTSAAAPGLAGRVANVLARLREDAGLVGAGSVRGAGEWFVPAGALAPGSAPIGPAEVRAALNRTASYWSATEWSPQPDSNLLYTVGNSSLPVNPLLPAAQFGWGYVDWQEEEATYQLLREYALTRDRALLENPAEKGANRAFMEHAYAAREAYWRAKTG